MEKALQDPSQRTATKGGAKLALQNAVIRLSHLVPQSLRSRLAASSYGVLARRILDRMGGETHPVVHPIGPLLGKRLRVNWALHKTYVFGTHEPHVMQILRELVQPGWTVVDIGANIGYSALVLAKYAGPTGKVYAFEPLTENFKMLQENIQLNHSSNIVAENLAVMARPGQIELRSATPGALTWVASVNVAEDSAVESQSVTAVSLDDYVQHHDVGRIHFVKMDVEGAEGSVLEGMTAILKRDQPVLMIELHGYDQLGENHPALLLLKEQKYRVTSFVRRNWEVHILAEPINSPPVAS
jgi:FkbM family methyltransferase